MQARPGITCILSCCRHRSGGVVLKIGERNARLRDGDAVAQEGESDSETTISNGRRWRGDAQQRTVTGDYANGAIVDGTTDNGCDKLGRHEWHDVGMHRAIQRLAIRVAVRMAQGGGLCGSSVTTRHVMMFVSATGGSNLVQGGLTRHTRACVCSDSKLHEQYADQHEQCRVSLG